MRQLFLFFHFDSCFYALPNKVFVSFRVLRDVFIDDSEKGMRYFFYQNSFRRIDLYFESIAISWDINSYDSGVSV